MLLFTAVHDTIIGEFRQQQDQSCFRGCPWVSFWVLLGDRGTEEHRVTCKTNPGTVALCAEGGSLAKASLPGVRTLLQRQNSL